MVTTVRQIDRYRGVPVLPGTVVEAPGCFRISLTASDEMVDRGLAGFAAARSAALDHGPG